MAAAIKSPNRNPNSRSSEMNNPMRRSFTGNPFAKPSIVTKQKGFNPVTPANSPADFPRRSSMSRESIPSLQRDHADKENGKEQELKYARVRSPSVLKGAKNFMSPTISAASKVAASPKKKILADKNEPLRTSVSSSSDGKASFNSVSFSDVLEFIDAKPETESNHDSAVPEVEHKVAALETPLIPKVLFTPKIDSTHRPGARVVEEDCVNLDWSSLSSSPYPSGGAAVLAPLDADPVRPYDPETNFTSPRPQFLRYRPNRRVELYRERHGKGLEDSFISESSSSDAEFTEETETQSEDSQKEYPEDVSSCEMVTGELMKEEVSTEMVQDDNEVSDGTSQTKKVSGEAVKGEEEEEVLHVAVANPMSKEAMEAKRVSKLHFLKRPKTVAFLITLLVACLSVSVTDSPVVGLVLKDPSYSTFYVPAEFTEYAKAHLDGLVQCFEVWYANSMSYLSELVSSVGARRLGTVKYSNLTALYDDHNLSFDLHDLGTKREFQDNVLLEPIMVWERGVAEAESFEEKVFPEIEVNENGSEDSEGHEDENVEVEVQDIQESEVHGDLVAVPESEVLENSEVIEEEHNIPEAEASETNSLEAEKLQDDIDVPAPNMETNSESSGMDSAELPKAPEAELSGAMDIRSENDLYPSVETESTEADETPESSELPASTEGARSLESASDFIWIKDELLKLNALGIALLFLALLASTAFSVYKRKQNTPASIANTPADQPLLAKKFDISPKSASSASVEEHSFHERLSSQNWPTEVDLVGASCPSEMSSFQKSSSYYSNKGLKDSTEEAQSQDRKPKKSYNKRESLASSDDYSVGSLTASYGSFTTYEKIPAKRVNGEEITPVRRSSRIRKQVMSP